MKKLRFWLIALLCLVTALGCLSATSRAADTDDIYNGCTVKFGSYPQTRVKDSALGRLVSAFWPSLQTCSPVSWPSYLRFLPLP